MKRQPIRLERKMRASLVCRVERDLYVTIRHLEGIALGSAWARPFLKKEILRLSRLLTAAGREHR